MVRNVARAARRNMCDLTSFIRSDPVFILGNQKSGTTAIAELLSATTATRYSRDMFYHRGWTDPDALYRGEVEINDLIKRGRSEFARRIIKDPDLTFAYCQLAARFPHARCVFIVRHPAENIRSILNRHALPGDCTDEAESSAWIKELSPLWRVVFTPEALQLPGGNYVDVLAQRWTRAAEVYFQNSRDMVLVKYEDFNRDKVGVIHKIADALSLRSEVDISHLVDKQFQRKGDHSKPLPEFFGTENFERIREWCSAAARKFGYEI